MQHNWPHQYFYHSLFVMSYLLNPFVKKFFPLFKAFFAIANLIFTSLWLLPSSVITEPTYFKLLTCSILCSSTVLTKPLPLHSTSMVFVLNINFHAEVLSTFLKPNFFINLCNP